MNRLPVNGKMARQEGGLRLSGVKKTALPNKPLISIITVVFNGEPTLEATIQSVIAQTYDNFEYIVIDGASTDGTLAILSKYEHAIDYWLSEPDHGIYDAFNKALTLIHGEYYLILGSDDEIFPDGLREIAETELKKSTIDFVVASIMSGNNRRSGMHPKRGWLGAHSMITGHSVGLLIRTKVHETIGPYSTVYQLAADALFIKKLFYAGFCGKQSDVLVGRFAIDGASNSNLARGLCEGFLVQLETEKNKTLQVIIFIARLLKNIHKLSTRK